MSLLDLFPQPQQLTTPGPTISLDDRALAWEGVAALPPLAQRAVELVQSTLSTTSAAAPYTMRVALTPDETRWETATHKEEAYLLELGVESGQLIAHSAAGLFAGCQTLLQLVSDQPAELPALRIFDWPDLRYRGLYIESKWGPDLMTLEEWQACIDRMAELKFNSLGMGIHCCWVVQYGGKTTEFLMVPFPDYPTLATPKTLRYYAPSVQGWKTLEYLPAMFTEDFFGQVVAYGKANNITVRPHFNTPGHNTLIPRAYPDVSAKSEEGAPLGYGFCFSNPHTYELLFALYDSIIQRYLRPHEIDWFHIGLDEVTGYMGIDPAKPFEVLEPWCHCPICRQQSPMQHLQEYAVRVCSHLKEQGINHITMWNDGLDHLGGLNAQFVEMLEAAGLRENVVVQWWRYREPALVPRRELGLRAWVTPMAGYWSNFFTQSYTSNIYSMLLHGYRAGAEGADAYCIYDPAYDRNYTCLAQYAWNQSSSEDLYQFKSRYARSKLGKALDPALATEAFEKYDQAFDSMAWTSSVLDSLLYYWHTYPVARQKGLYPFKILVALADDPMRLRGGIQQVTMNAKAARDLFARANAQAADPLLEEFMAECDKVIGVWASLALLVRAIQQYERVLAPGVTLVQVTQELTQVGELIRQAREQLITVIADLERVKMPYLRPQILRDLSILLVYMEQWQGEMADLAHGLTSGQLQALPGFAQLKLNQHDFDPFVSSAVSGDVAQAQITPP